MLGGVCHRKSACHDGWEGEGSERFNIKEIAAAIQSLQSLRSMQHGTRAMPRWPRWFLLSLLRFLDGDMDACWALVYATGYDWDSDDAVVWFLIE